MNVRGAAFQLGVAAVGALAFAGCGATIVTKKAHPEPLGPVPKVTIRGSSGSEDSRVLRGKELAAAMTAWAGTDSVRLATAAGVVLRQAENPPMSWKKESIGFTLLAARLAWQSLVQSEVPAARWPSENPEALALYNRAVDSLAADFYDVIATGEALTIPTPVGSMSLESRFAPGGQYAAGYFDRVLPAGRVAIRGFRERAATGQVGSALVGERDPTKEREGELEFQPPGTGVAAPLGGVLWFEGDRAVFEVVDSTRVTDAVIDGSALAIHADFTTPFAISLSGINDLWLGIRGLLNVGKWEDWAGVYLTEPFDPERLPVLLIHGLSSSPLVWRNIVSSVYLDPGLQRRVQFLYAYYPTGAPVVQSSAWIRDSLAKVRTPVPPPSAPARNVSIVGYSMGGVIAQILSTDVGDRLWRRISDEPFDDLPLDADDREELRSWMFWQAVPGVDQVIFIATPHRGTALADSSIGSLGSALVRLPGDLLKFQARVFSALGDFLDGDLGRMRAANGINSLSEWSPLYAALDETPFAPGVRVYSIIGDRGRGDSPNSSDGIVSYASSHLPGVESELIVPTGHDAQASPKSEAEIRRILTMGVEGMAQRFPPSQSLRVPFRRSVTRTVRR